MTNILKEYQNCSHGSMENSSEEFKKDLENDFSRKEDTREASGRLDYYIDYSLDRLPEVDDAIHAVSEKVKTIGREYLSIGDYAMALHHFALSAYLLDATYPEGYKNGHDGQGFFNNKFNSIANIVVTMILNGDENAKEFADDMQNINPDHPLTFITQGLYIDRWGDPQRAREMFQQAIGQCDEALIDSVAKERSQEFARSSLISSTFKTAQDLFRQGSISEAENLAHEGFTEWLELYNREEERHQRQKEGDGPGTFMDDADFQRMLFPVHLSRELTSIMKEEFSGITKKVENFCQRDIDEFDQGDNQATRAIVAAAIKPTAINIALALKMAKKAVDKSYLGWAKLLESRRLKKGIDLGETSIEEVVESYIGTCRNFWESGWSYWQRTTLNELGQIGGQDPRIRRITSESIEKNFRRTGDNKFKEMIFTPEGFLDLGAARRYPKIEFSGSSVGNISECLKKIQSPISIFETLDGLKEKHYKDARQHYMGVGDLTEYLFRWVYENEDKKEYCLGRFKEYQEYIIAKEGRAMDEYPLPEGDEEWLEVLVRASYLHDIGKVGVADAILNNHGRPSEEEFDRIKQHPEIGKRLLEYMDTGKFRWLYIAAAEGHQRAFTPEGRGYPNDGIYGREINPMALLMRLVDEYDAMARDREYRRGMPSGKVIDIIKSGSGKNTDPEITQLFIQFVHECQSKIDEIIRRDYSFIERPLAEVLSKKGKVKLLKEIGKEWIEDLETVYRKIGLTLSESIMLTEYPHGYRRVLLPDLQNRRRSTDFKSTAMSLAAQRGKINNTNKDG